MLPADKPKKNTTRRRKPTAILAAPNETSDQL